MITTDKNTTNYVYTCDCGLKHDVASNQPTGDTFPTICTCFTKHLLMIPETDGKHQYKMRDETKALRIGIIEIYQNIRRTMTVRQVFYQAVSRGLVPKDEDAGYKLIQRNLLDMRRHGHLPYELVSDVSRRMMKPTTFDGLDHALDNWMHYYRQDVWAKQDETVEIWLEKDALSSIFWEITQKYDVPLYIVRGFSSESFLFEAAQMIKRSGKKTYVYFFSDYDPSGLALCNQVETMLPRFGADIVFHRAALTQDQILSFNLPTRPTKKSNHSKNFIGQSVDIDALHPNTLISMVESCILNHISERDLENIRNEEEVQRDTIRAFKNNLGLAHKC